MGKAHDFPPPEPLGGQVTGLLRRLVLFGPKKLPEFGQNVGNGDQRFAVSEVR